MAIIPAAAAELGSVGQPVAGRASRAIYEAVFEAVFDSVKTSDLGGHALTTEFTDAVIRSVTPKLELCTALA